MMEFLHFTFSNPRTAIGVILLVVWTLDGIAKIVKAARKGRR